MSSALLWIRAFSLTLAVEEPIAVPLLRPVERSTIRRVTGVLLANLATHPLVWFFFPHLGWAWQNATFAAEVWAFGFEIIAYRCIFARATWVRCALLSIAANGGSFLLGLVVAKWGWLR